MNFVTEHSIEYRRIMIIYQVLYPLDMTEMEGGGGCVRVDNIPQECSAIDFLYIDIC